MDELEKVIEEELNFNHVDDGFDTDALAGFIVQAVRAHLKEEGWVKRGMSYEEFLDKSKM